MLVESKKELIDVFWFPSENPKNSYSLKIIQTRHKKVQDCELKTFIKQQFQFFLSLIFPFFFLSISFRFPFISFLPFLSLHLLFLRFTLSFPFPFILLSLSFSFPFQFLSFYYICVSNKHV